MRRLLLSAALIASLGGCGENNATNNTESLAEKDGEFGLEPEKQTAATGTGGASAGTASDPEARNGLVKEMLNGRAFTVRDFGSAPEGNAEQVIRGLEASARAGSGQASYAIYLKLFQCNNLLKPENRMTPVHGPAWEECKDLSPERLMESVGWLRLAAGQGHLGAQIYFASDAETMLGGVSGIFKDPDATKEYKRQSMEYLEAAARRGSVDALSRLGDDYLHGLRVERDPVVSYAYYLALQRANSRTTSSLNMKYLERELSVAQVESAKRKSKEIYDECCSGYACAINALGYMGSRANSRAWAVLCRDQGVQ